MTQEQFGVATPESRVASAVQRVAELDDYCDEWTELARECGNVFSTWEWASVWWRHRIKRESLLLFVGRDQHGRVDLIVPLYLWTTRPFRVARFLGHGPADQLGPVFRTADRGRAAAALRQVVADAGVDLLLAELLPGGEGWGAALHSRLLSRESSPTLSLAGGWEQFLAARSANFRQQVRGRQRRLERRFTVRFRLAADPAQLQDDLTLLFSLHHARWGKSGSAFTPWEPFHRDFAAVALDRGWLRLWFLELDDRPVAAWYGFRFGGVESYYQAGRDPGRSDASVGFVLLAHTIREAAVDGMREYRFLRGAEPFKLRFADQDPGLETLALARGRKGRIAAAAAAAALRSPVLRTVVRRLGGRHTPAS